MPGQSKLTNAPVRANGDSPGGRSRLRCGEERCKSYLLGLLGLMLPKRLAGSKTGAASARESQRCNARSQTDRQTDRSTTRLQKCPGECKTRVGAQLGRLLATARATDGGGVC